MDQLLKEFAAVGIAQALPGLRRMRQVALASMDAEIEKLEALLAECGGIAQANANGRARPKKPGQAMLAAVEVAEAKRGRGSGNIAAWWAKMTPEERKAEMRRRMAKRREPLNPPKIGEFWTSTGAARELGIKTPAALAKIRRLGLGHLVPVPAGMTGAKQRLVISAAELKRLRERGAQ